MKHSFNIGVILQSISTEVSESKFRIWKKQNLEVFLSNRSNLIHAKNGETFGKLLKYCRERGFNNEIFYHTTEDYVLTTRGNIIAYPGEILYDDNLCMMPESMGRNLSEEEKNNIIEICSDSLEVIRSIIQ